MPNPSGLDSATRARFKALRRGFEALANPGHAEFHRAYHKSQLRFYGLRVPQFDKLFLEQFPRREKLEREAGLMLVRALWASDWAEERWAALALLERLQPQLTADDLPLLKSIADGCDGWGVTDMFTLRVLGPLAIRLGDAIYQPVMRWLDDPHLWTRRAAILIHCLPGRKAKLAHQYAWPALEARLFEKEFFIRKAIGWTLREIGKHYPEEVCEFLLQVGERASPLTRREGARNLPEALRLQVLGK